MAFLAETSLSRRTKVGGHQDLVGETRQGGKKQKGPKLLKLGFKAEIRKNL